RYRAAGLRPRGYRWPATGHAEGNEVVLTAVQEQHGDSDVRQLEPPRVEVGAAVIPISLAAGREPIMNGICQPCGHLALALQDGYIDRRRHGREPLGHIAGR